LDLRDDDCSGRPEAEFVWLDPNGLFRLGEIEFETSAIADEPSIDEDGVTCTGRSILEILKLLGVDSDIAGKVRLMDAIIGGSDEDPGIDLKLEPLWTVSNVDGRPEDEIGVGGGLGLELDVESSVTGTRLVCWLDTDCSLTVAWPGSSVSIDVLLTRRLLVHGGKWTLVKSSPSAKRYGGTGRGVTRAETCAETCSWGNHDCAVAVKHSESIGNP
jgi:hypothetical protein